MSHDEANDAELGDAQRRHWQDTYRTHPGMYGGAPSAAAIHAAAEFVERASRVLELPQVNRPAGGGQLSRFRRELFACLTARADGLFEVCDALSCVDGPVRSLPELSLAGGASPWPRRRV
jgi:hypothetical protein